uniref:Uncharacterized protein n=1 Tax=Romanomermis culicivorax TaxID=13658 RepID=A0A915IVQ9_ROMCU
MKKGIKVDSTPIRTLRFMDKISNRKVVNLLSPDALFGIRPRRRPLAANLLIVVDGFPPTKFANRNTTMTSPPPIVDDFLNRTAE